MKSIFFLLILFNITYAQFETISVGSIDKHYQDTLSKQQLQEMIKEIEYLFESQLGFNVFDYSEDGKPIDVLYIPPSTAKKRLLRNLKEVQSLKTKIDTLQLYISTNQKSIELSRKQLTNEYTQFNQSIESLNEDIAQTQQAIHPVIEDIMKRKQIIEKNKLSLDKRKKQFNRNLDTLKRKIQKYNLLISKYNRLNRDVEKLSNTLVEVKGVTKGKTKTIYKKYTEDDQTDILQKTNTYMEKIEIYSFENMKQLKVIIAHEIGHLVGVKHIDTNDALMNPLLQEKQLDELSLTYEDIQAFYKAFE